MEINLNPFSALSWMWRALRGHSITFSALFAMGVLGVSLISEFRHVLTRFDAPWYVWLLAPMLAIGYLAKKEEQWVPDPEKRKRWARWLFFGSIALAILIAKFGPRRAEPQAETPAARAESGR